MWREFSFLQQSKSTLTFCSWSKDRWLIPPCAQHARRNYERYLSAAGKATTLNPSGPARPGFCRLDAGGIAGGHGSFFACGGPSSCSSFSRPPSTFSRPSSTPAAPFRHYFICWWYENAGTTIILHDLMTHIVELVHNPVLQGVVFACRTTCAVSPVLLSSQQQDKMQMHCLHFRSVVHVTLGVWTMGSYLDRLSLLFIVFHWLIFY